MAVFRRVIAVHSTKLEIAMNQRIAVLLILLFLSTSASSRADPVLFMADGQTNSIYTVDTLTGAATLVGNTGIDVGFVGLGFDSFTDELFMSSSINGDQPGESLLYRISPDSGTATFVGSTGVANLTGLAFDRSRQRMFAGTGNSDMLYSLNTSNATASLVGEFGVNVGGHGLAYDPDSDVLLLSDFNTDRLYEINPDTGAATTIGSTQLDGVVALAYDAQASILYGVDVNSDELIRFDSATGVGTPVGFLGVDVFNVGLAFTVTAIPEPSAFLTCSAVASCLLLRCKR